MLMSPIALVLHRFPVSFYSPPPLIVPWDWVDEQHLFNCWLSLSHLKYYSLADPPFSPSRLNASYFIPFPPHRRTLHVTSPSSPSVPCAFEILIYVFFFFIGVFILMENFSCIKLSKQKWTQGKFEGRPTL